MKKGNWLLVPAVALTMPVAAGGAQAPGVIAALTGVQAAAVAPPAAMPNGAKPKKDRLICRSEQDFDTGSHIRSGKKCLRESEWREREDSAQRFFRSVDDRSAVGEITPPAMAPR
jgi:hypothetical protein